MKFGINRIDITPDYRTLMDGYGGRNDINDGVNDPLTFTSLVLEEKEKKIFIGAVDLVGLDHNHSIEMRKKIAKSLGMDFSGVMLNCSHTHGGIKARLPRLKSEDPEISARNMKFVEEKILSSAKAAGGAMQNGTLFYGEGKTSIPMNRRPMNDAGKLENRPNPKGKTDSSLKVLKILDSKNEVAAVIVRVSCHAVATGAQHLITADFPGAFRSVFEKFFPKSTAIFLQGVGADARPAMVADKNKWRTMPHSELVVIGEQLFRETLQVLLKEMTPLKNLSFVSGIKEIFLPIVKGKVDIEQIAAKFKMMEYDVYVAKLRNMIEKGGKIPSGLPISVQMIRFNNEFSIAGVDAELLCGMGEKMDKKIKSRFKMVLGYTNGSQTYLPDKNEYKRGGYEVDSHIIHSLPFPLSPAMEDIVLDATAELNKKLFAGR